MVQKLIEIPENAGYKPLVKLPEDVVKFIAERPYQPPSYNGYICRRRPQHIILCVDVHSGVTPMFLGCRHEHCDSSMVSAGYPNNGQGPVPEHLRDKPLYLWYRPSEDEFRKLPAEVRGHVMQGGLVLNEHPTTLAHFEQSWAAHGA